MGLSSTTPGYVAQSFAAVRQTVLSGAVDSNGQAAILRAGTGLAVDLLASTVPVAMTLAAGFDALGPLDKPVLISADQVSAWTGLPASTTAYLYLDRNATTGKVTFGYSAVAPAYQATAPSAPATGQHWFDLSTFTMKAWTGSAWSTVQRVFVGECVTGASSVSTVTSYAFRGRYDSGYFAVSASVTYNKNHSLGFEPAHMNHCMMFRQNSTYQETPVNGMDAYYAGTWFGEGGVYSLNRLTAKVAPASGQNNNYVNPDGALLTGAASGSVTSGEYRLILSRNW